MSNFVFLNNKKFLIHPSCALLYEHASAAEAAYFDHEKCALKVRFVLEQFCIFVSELKNASYPEKIVMLGQYWGNRNLVEFIKTFGHENYCQIKRANTISRSFLHSMGPSREDIYPQMLESVYILLLWLYKELGFHTSLNYSDYDIKNIPTDTVPSGKSLQDIYHSSEELKKNLKNLFPNCNTDQLCSVTKQDDRYIITDMYGNQTEEFITAEKYEYSEKERVQLKKQLEQAGKEFETAKNEFLEKQNRQETLIAELNAKIVDITRQNEIPNLQQRQEIFTLQNRVKELEQQRTHIAETYKKSLQELGNRYDSLQEEYEELVPLKEKKLQMQKRIASLIHERERQEKLYSESQKTLLYEIASVKQRLSSAQRELSSMGTSAQENQKIIQNLKTRLSEKENELLAAQNMAKKQLEKLQAETRETIQKYEDKTNSLEIILTNIMAENARFREQSTRLPHTEDTKNYLQLVRQGVSQIEEGYALYQQNKNEQKLREYLWRLKTYYESKIDSLERDLKEKEEKLAQEQQKCNTLFESLWEEAQTQAIEDSPKPEPTTDDNDPPLKRKRPKKKKRRRWLAVLAASFLGLNALIFLVNYREYLSHRESQSASADDAMQKNAAIPGNTVIPKNAEGNSNEENPSGGGVPGSSDEPPENTDESEKRLADRLLDDAQTEKEQVEALPKTIEDIPGVSQDLLDDMEMMRGIFSDFYRVAYPRFGEDTEEYQSLGAYHMFNTVRTVYKIDSLKASKFVCCLPTKTGFSLAVTPDAISPDFSYHTSLSDLEAILGEANTYEFSSTITVKPTDFSEDLSGGKYMFAIFTFEAEGDSQDSPRTHLIRFVYNEAMSEILDYVYVSELMD